MIVLKDCYNDNTIYRLLDFKCELDRNKIIEIQNKIDDIKMELCKNDDWEVNDIIVELSNYYEFEIYNISEYTLEI